MRAWRREMAALAAHPQVMCKLSGLLTEMAPQDRTGRARILDRLRPVVEALVIMWFGPRRLMFGSDWPVLTLAATYDDWVAFTHALLAPLSAPTIARRCCRAVRAASMASSEPGMTADLVSMRGISKHFPGVRALDDARASTCARAKCTP